MRKAGGNSEEERLFDLQLSIINNLAVATTYRDDSSHYAKLDELLKELVSIKSANSGSANFTITAKLICAFFSNNTPIIAISNLDKFSNKKIFEFVLTRSHFKEIMLFAKYGTKIENNHFEVTSHHFDPKYRHLYAHYLRKLPVIKLEAYHRSHNLIYDQYFLIFTDLYNVKDSILTTSSIKDLFQEILAFSNHATNRFILNIISTHMSSITNVNALERGSLDPKEVCNYLFECFNPITPDSNTINLEQTTQKSLIIKQAISGCYLLPFEIFEIFFTSCITKINLIGNNYFNPTLANQPQLEIATQKEIYQLTRQALQQKPSCSPELKMLMKRVYEKSFELLSLQHYKQEYELYCGVSNPQVLQLKAIESEMEIDS